MRPPVSSESKPLEPRLCVSYPPQGLWLHVANPGPPGPGGATG
jgi:hypothetical protein